MIYTIFGIQQFTKGGDRDLPKFCSILLFQVSSDKCIPYCYYNTISNIVWFLLICFYLNCVLKDCKVVYKIQ